MVDEITSTVHHFPTMAEGQNTRSTTAGSHERPESPTPQENNEVYALRTLPNPGSSQDCQASVATAYPEPDQRAPGFIPHNVETTSRTEVDVVLVPCPGADPLKTWLGERGRNLWTTDGIRKLAPLAHVMTYDHGDVKQEWSLKNLAIDLLRLLLEERSFRDTDPDADLKRKTRPLFFICHSIGGLVVKVALTLAHRHSRYQSIVESCHGVTFFATPHYGSIHLFMDDFKSNIQEVLDLSAPLPSSLTQQLNLDDQFLHKIDENFKQLAGEFLLWTFYETKDSLLDSSSKTTGSQGIQYTAPITPMRSAILGVRHEKVYALRSTHAECAWFEDQDRHILRPYLRNLCDTILKAATIHSQHRFNTLQQRLSPKGLESKVRIEVHGFYENKTPAEVEPIVRLLVVKQTLDQLLLWGPGELLRQRLVNRKPLELDYGPILNREFTIGRGFLWTGQEQDDDKLSLSDLRPARRKYPGPRQKRQASNLEPRRTETSTPSLAPRQKPSSTAQSPHVSDQLRVEDKKFEWVHVPFNNPLWVEKVFETLSVHDARDYGEIFSASHWGSRHTRARHPQHHACFLKPTCGTVSFQEPLIPNCHYLYLPYLHFDSYKAVIKRRKLIKERPQQGRCNPVPAWVPSDESLELKLIWVFLGHDPPINCRRTLDQYQYPSIHDTRARDDDQVLYKLTKEPLTDGIISVGVLNEEDDVINGNLLMVDQLWMWIMETPDHKSRLVTFYPRRDGSPAEGPLFGQADLRDITHNDLNAGLAQRCKTASDLAALTILHAVTVLIDRSTDPDLDIFRIFEEAVSILTETMTSSLKRFGMSAFSSEHNYQRFEAIKSLSIRDRHRLEVERAREESRNSTSTLLELRDVEDELKSLMNLFGEQQDHIQTFLDISEVKVDEDQTASQRASGDSLTSNGRSFLVEALEKLKAYKSQVQDMIGRVQKALRDFDRLLEIVQKQTQLEEGYISRHQADLTKVQNRSVIIFTVFSVVFLPLSFFTSVFGMNTREWGGGDNLSLSTIFSIGIPISVTLIAGTVIAAWIIAEGAGYGHARRWVKKAKRRLSKMMPVALRRRQRVLKKIRILEQQRKEIINPDFWERHRLERSGRYEIPPGNRKSATLLERARKMAAERKENWDMEAVEQSEGSMSDY